MIAPKSIFQRSTQSSSCSKKEEIQLKTLSASMVNDFETFSYSSESIDINSRDPRSSKLTMKEGSAFLQVLESFMKLFYETLGLAKNQNRGKTH